MNDKLRSGRRGVQRGLTAMAPRLLGLVPLLICLASTMLLVMRHFGRELPGCGPGSGCDQASTSTWSQVAGWPISFIGLAYFAALTAAWTISSHIPALFRHVVRVGAVVSVGFVLLMVLGRQMCWYCLVALAGNLLFWLFVELRGKGQAERSGRTGSPQTTSLHPAVTTMAATFALVSAVLNVARTDHQHALALRERSAASESSAVPLANEGDERAAVSDPEAIRSKPSDPDWITAASDRPPPGDFPPEVVAATRAATVRIAAGKAVGSGVIIGQRGTLVYVLTAEHVVRDLEGVEVHLFSAESPARPPAVCVDVQLLATDPLADVALLQVVTTAPVSSIVVVCPRDAVPDDEGFVALSAGGRGMAAPRWEPVAVRGKKQVKKHAGAAPTWVWEVDGELAPGRSGGPLVDRRGYLLGVASGTSTGYGYYCHTGRIHDLLRQSAHEWLVPRSPLAPRVENGNG